MKQALVTITIGAMLFTVGCSSSLDVHKVTLQSTSDQCTENGCFQFYSFTAGTLETPPADPGQIDLVCYFDCDDCFHGTLFGHEDRPGSLFPIGHLSWHKLKKLTVPTKNMPSVTGINLTEDNEGLAFWVKTGRGPYILARIKSIKSATYADLTAGGTASVKIEWARPRMGEFLVYHPSAN